MAKEKTGVTRVAPYNGNEDYIFISYSHRDMDTVLPILARMKQAGYRFWYDEGIDPGSEWPESIADHLSRCRVCLGRCGASSGPEIRPLHRHALSLRIHKLLHRSFHLRVRIFALFRLRAVPLAGL